MNYIDRIRDFYTTLEAAHEDARKRLGRGLTLAEKILFSHLHKPEAQSLERGESYLLLQPDRVATQDATAQMVLFQFMLAGKAASAVPATVHCDHLIQAKEGAATDLSSALKTNQEVYAFLESASCKYGLEFWRPGAGIIHQVVLENYAFPGGLMIGADSHTPNAGGLGMLACGVGGADVVDVMVGLPWEVKCPRLIGVRLTGKMSGWTSPKDVILKICGLLTAKGGTNHVVEYFGPGVSSISATGKATIANMGAEIGATSSVFPFDERIRDYLKATGRDQIAELAASHQAQLTADEAVLADPDAYYDQVIEIDLTNLEPYVVGPHSPDAACPLSEFAHQAKAKGYAMDLRAALIGSCTNSSYEDIGCAAHIAKQAAEAGIVFKSRFFVSPGSSRIFDTIKRDGQLDALTRIGGVVLANACGPCVGQWDRQDNPSGKANSIMTSFNRNFRKRNDGNTETLAFIASPQIVTAMALSGDLGFNPLTDALETPDGKVYLVPPESSDLPEDGFVSSDDGVVLPTGDKDIKVAVDPASNRLQILEPFNAWDGKDLKGLPLLLKAQGKCTTDHISPAGPWLRFRGHLENISDNMFISAVNAFTEAAGKGLDQLNKTTKPFSENARHYKAEGLGWVVVGDDNYGEGSSREHAAMSPRLLGCRAVITRSFARIHETNLKKQGILALTFINSQDYEKVLEMDKISILGLSGLTPGKHLHAVFAHEDGSKDQCELRHTLNAEQIEWFKAGSALNCIRKQT